MIENHCENILTPITKIAQSPKKNENIIYSTAPPANQHFNRYLKSNSMHPNQQTVHLIHKGWVPPNAQLGPTRILSPNTILMNTSPSASHRTSFVEIGNSRQKKTSPNRITVTLAGQQLGNPQCLNRKIAILQGRIKELHRQKQTMAAEMNQKVNKILSQNQRLISIIKHYEQKNLSQTGDIKVQAKPQQEEFNLEQMLESQINLNLQLREQNQKIKHQCQSISKQKQDLQSTISQAQASNQLLKVSFQKLQLKVKQYQQNTTSLQQARKKRQLAIQQLIQQKQKQILGLEQQNYELSKRIQQNTHEIAELGQQLSTAKMQHLCESQQLQTLKNQLQELSRPQQCKKCKDLLHTVFRLNSQLNKK